MRTKKHKLDTGYDYAYNANNQLTKIDDAVVNGLYKLYLDDDWYRLVCRENKKTKEKFFAEVYFFKHELKNEIKNTCIKTYNKFSRLHSGT